MTPNQILKKDNVGYIDGGLSNGSHTSKIDLIKWHNHVH